MNTRQSSGMFATLKKVVPLALVFAVVLYLADKVSREGIPSQLRFLLDSPVQEYGELLKYTDEQKSRVKKYVAGFRQSRSGEGRGLSFVRTIDRLELKDNGYVWQVKTHRVGLPSGDTTLLRHIIHGYVQPFGHPPGDSSEMVVDIFVIRQVFQYDTDTCYGESNQARTRRLERRGGTLLIDGREYTNYGEASLDTFFHPGSIDLIDRFALSDCPHAFDLHAFARGRVLESISGLSSRYHTPEQAGHLIEKYYEPLLSPLLRAVRERQGSDDTLRVAFKLAVDAEGDVDSVSMTSRTSLPVGSADALKRRIGEWVFPPAAEGEGAGMEVEYLFRSP